MIRHACGIDPSWTAVSHLESIALYSNSICAISRRLVVDLLYSKSTTNRFVVDLLYGWTICCRFAADLPSICGKYLVTWPVFLTMAVKTIIKTSFCAQIRITRIVLTSPEKPQHFDSPIDRICRISYIRTVPADVLNIVHNLAHASSFFHWHSCLRPIKKDSSLL